MYNVGTAKHKRTSVFVCAHNNGAQNRVFLFQTCCLYMTLERKRGKNKQEGKHWKESFEIMFWGYRWQRFLFHRFLQAMNICCTAHRLSLPRVVHISCFSVSGYIWMLHVMIKICNQFCLRPLFCFVFLNHCQCWHMIYKELCSSHEHNSNFIEDSTQRHTSTRVESWGAFNSFYFKTFHITIEHKT